ncbi:MAG: NADP-dependent oxidoreductase [Mycobacteriales bacterium]
MRVIETPQFGGPEVLQVVERPEPVAGPGQVRVRVEASTVNPADTAARAGYLTPAYPQVQPPFVAGWDFAGTLLDAAAGLPAGQRVAGLVPWLDTLRGTNAEVIAVDPAWLAPVPDGVDPAEAASLGMNGQAARQALDLVEELAGSPLAAGRSLLVTGGSGAVGGFAVQLAAATGVQVIAVASRGDEAYVSGLGAKEVVARGDSTADLVAAVRALAPDGVDAALDAGVAGPELLGAVRDGGAFVAVIVPATPEPERGIRAGMVSVTPDGATLAGLLEAHAAGQLRTRIERVPFADAAEAHRRAEAGGLHRKLVLTP